MAIITQHTVRCPYCGGEKEVEMKSEHLEHSRITSCDRALCQRIYVVQLVLLPRVQVYELTPAGSNEPIDDYDKRRDIEAPAVQ